MISSILSHAYGFIKFTGTGGFFLEDDTSRVLYYFKCLPVAQRPIFLENNSTLFTHSGIKDGDKQCKHYLDHLPKETHLKFISMQTSESYTSLSLSIKFKNISAFNTLLYTLDNSKDRREAILSGEYSVLSLAVQQGFENVCSKILCEFQSDLERFNQINKIVEPKFSLHTIQPYRDIPNFTSFDQTLLRMYYNENSHIVAKTLLRSMSDIEMRYNTITRINSFNENSLMTAIRYNREDWIAAVLGTLESDSLKRKALLELNQNNNDALSRINDNEQDEIITAIYNSFDNKEIALQVLNRKNKYGRTLITEAFIAQRYDIYEELKDYGLHVQDEYEKLSEDKLAKIIQEFKDKDDKMSYDHTENTKLNNLPHLIYNNRVEPMLNNVRILFRVKTEEQIENDVDKLSQRLKTSCKV